MTRPRLGRRAVRIVLGLALIPAAGLGVRWWTGNVGEIVPGVLHRSAQLDAGHLSRLLQERGIRTVINLRGPNPDASWYRAERAATLAAGATLIDLPLASDQWLSRAQARTLVEVLDSAETPALIHCQWGAERTGLVAAFAQLLRPDGGIARAEAAFSPYYLFARVQDGKVMAGHLDAYEAWLAARRLDHTPERFRGWLLGEYRPLGPSRETWSFNPYPLVVVTRPTPAPVPSRIAADARADQPR